MNLSSAILVILLRQPVYEEDTGPSADGSCATSACEQRLVLLGQTADAIAAVASTEHDRQAQVALAAAEITIGYFETHFAVYVLMGECKLGKFKCDLDRNGEPRAIGFGQVWHWCTAAWDAVPGSYASILATAQCVSTRWHGAKFRCLTIPGAFSGYRANRCDWPEGVKRAAKFALIRNDLANLLKK